MKKERLRSQCDNAKKRNFTKKMFFAIAFLIAVQLDISAYIGQNPSGTKSVSNLRIRNYPML